MNVLVLNCGSSTVKFQIVETDLELIECDADRRLARGVVERIGGKSLCSFGAEGRRPTREARPIRDHEQALDAIARWIVSPDSHIQSITSIGDIHAVGHRVVHGGEAFKASTLITPEVLEGIEDCVGLAPLHNPANLKGYRAARRFFGEGIPQAAVFDTAFHSTMPDTAFLYAIPYPLYRRHRIRRYGFHGTSHRYIGFRYRTMLGLEREQVNIISLHLGNGCSACAIQGGVSVDTSMGMTPLEGLVMGTRCGDIDPSLVEFIATVEGLSVSEVDSLLNKQSGLLGLSCLTGDVRDLLAERAETGDRRVGLALDIFCNRVKKYIGGYLATMGGADALVFTGGIGENSAEVRAQILHDLGFLGIEVDDERNRAVVSGEAGPITADGCRLPAYVIPTNEELLIARDTVRCIEGVEHH